MNDLLRGAYDLHFHTSPDVTARKCSDIELAHRLVQAGMKGCVIKNHYFETAARAALLREQFPELEIVGGITLNRSVGGLNPYAVEKVAQMGGKFMWFPTMDALHYQRYQHRTDLTTDLSGLLQICDDNGNLLSEAQAVLSMAAKHNLIVCTGHISPEEGLAVLREGSRLGIAKMIVTHADNPANRYTIEQQKKAVQLGAFIEHCYFTTYYGRTPIADIIQQIQSVGTQHVFLSTDFGQLSSPHSDEGMRGYAESLLEKGLTDKEIRQMICDNPKQILQSYFAVVA